MTKKKRYGKTEPRVFTPPLRELTPETSLGYDAIDFIENVLGEKLFPWEAWLLIHILEITGDLQTGWQFRFKIVFIEVARQNGKTQLLEWLILWFLYVLEVPLLVGAAQNLSMAQETWEHVVNAIMDNDDLREEFGKSVLQNGNKELRLTGGRRYKIVSTDRKGGRGFRANVMIIDEMREQRVWDGWSALSPTVIAQPNSMIIGTSNAGDPSSVVLRRFRLIAHKAIGDPDGICQQLEQLGDEDAIGDVAADTLGWFEWSAAPNCPLDDRDGWAQANPSMGYSALTEDALAALSVGNEITFRTEHLCQWVESVIESPFPTDSWENGRNEHSYIAKDSPLFYGIDVSTDKFRHKIALAICGLTKDREWHTEVMAYESRTSTIVELLRKRVMLEGGSLTIALQGRGAPVSILAEALEAIKGVTVIRCEGPDLTGWTRKFYEGIAASETDADTSTTPIFHIPQPALDQAAQIAATRSLGDGAWTFNRKESPLDISPLIACVMACGLASSGLKPKRKSAYSAGREPVFL